jgi:hypothetical protein
MHILQRRAFETEAAHFQRLANYARIQGLKNEPWRNAPAAGVVRSVLISNGFLGGPQSRSNPDEMSFGERLTVFGRLATVAADLSEVAGRVRLIKYIEHAVGKFGPGKIIADLVQAETLRSEPNPFFSSNGRVREQLRKSIYNLYRNRKGCLAQAASIRISLLDLHRELCQAMGEGPGTTEWSKIFFGVHAKHFVEFAGPRHNRHPVKVHQLHSFADFVCFASLENHC